jgi:hypothetical protein
MGGLGAVEGASTFIAISASDAIAAVCDLPIEPTPEGHESWDVQHRSQRPEDWELSRQVAHCIGTAMSTTLRVDDPHLFHELIVGQVRVLAHDRRVVERDETESASGVHATKVADLARAELALSIVKHHILVHVDHSEAS